MESSKQHKTKGCYWQGGLIGRPDTVEQHMLVEKYKVTDPMPEAQRSNNDPGLIIVKAS